MEDLWNLKQPLHRSGSGGQQQQQQLQLIFAAGQDVGGASPFLAPEQCVIERTFRQETGAANVINFGLASQKQGARMDQNNHLLALLSAGSQQQQQQQLDQLTSRPHFQLSGPQAGYASDIPSRVLRNARLVLPETLRSSDVEFRTNQENMQQRFTEMESHHQRQVHALAPNKPLNSGSLSPASSGPRVYTLSISGFPISGDLLLSEAGRLEVVCSCHATRMPVSKFVQHAGFQTAAPGSVVFLESGESLIQWRKAFFSHLGLKVPDDDVGWDWNDAVWEADAAKHRTASGEANGLADLSGHPFQGKACHWSDTSPASVAQSPMTGYLSSGMVCSSSPVISNASRQLKGPDQALLRAVKGFPPTGVFSMGGPTSEFFDFINRGQAYCSSSFQQPVAMRDKCVPDNARPDKDNLFSSFELRLGQPSQPAHSIARDLRSRNMPSGADFQTSYERSAAEAGYQHVQAPGYAQHSFQGPTPPSSIQFTQSRLNLLRMEQQITTVSGSALNENGKLLTEFTQSHKLPQHQGDVGLSGIPCRTEILQAKQRPGNGRLLDDIVSTGQRSLSQAWMQRPCNSFVEGQRCGDILGVSAANEEQPRNYIGRECEGGSSNLPARGLVQTIDAVSQLPRGGASFPSFQAAGSNEPGSVVYASTSGQELQPATTKPLAAEEPRESSVLLSPVETAANGVLISDGANGAQAARTENLTPSGWMTADVRDAATPTMPEEAHKSTSENTSLNKELQSDVCSRGSANALDVPDANQEESTLECEEKRDDAVDEGSGIGKCSSNDQPSAVKKADSAVSLARRRRGGSASETTDNEIASGPGKRKAMKWRRVNTTPDAKDKEASGPLVAESRAAAELKAKRSTSRTSSEVATRRRNTIPPRADMPELRSRSKGASEISSLRKLRSIEGGVPDSKPPDTTRRCSFTGVTKMLSLKSILKLPSDRKPLSEEKQNSNVRGAARTEVRKRKLSELGSQRSAAADSQPTSSAKRPLPIFVPRGERSSRSGPRKPARMWLASKTQMLDLDASEVRSDHGNEELEQQPEEVPSTSAVPRRKRNAGGPSQASDSRRARRRLTDDNVLPDSSCFVCGTSTCEPSNELLCCCLCPVKVHQACYGVPKPPKGSWACRACKSNASNIACVLCGYGGGAMTRAQKTRTVVKGLVKLWSCEQRSSRSKRSKLSECEPLDKSSKNTIMAGVGDPSVTQWVHMVCALWMPGTRCVNVQTMGMFDVSGVTVARTRLACSICRRQGGSCIQCHEDKCAVAFHAWCAHTKGLLQIETVDDHVRFHGRCSLHASRADGSKRQRSGRLAF